MVAVFFLKKNLSQQEIDIIDETLKKFPLIKNIQFKNPEQALQKFKSTFPELVEIIDHIKTNPFPPSFEVSLNEKIIDSNEILGFIDEMKNMVGIEDVQFNRDWVEKMQSFSRLSRAVGLFFGGILVLASFFIISNVIRLNVVARKGEIEIQRLVGGTNTFISTPFLLEGIILGILGGLLSLFFLIIIIKIFPLYLGKSLGVFNQIVNFRYLSLVQCGGLITGGAFIGFAGSLSSLFRFLKV